MFGAALSKPPVTGCRNKFDSFFYPVHNRGGKETDSLGELKRDRAFARLSQEWFIVRVARYRSICRDINDSRVLRIVEVKWQVESETIASIMLIFYRSRKRVEFKCVIIFIKDFLPERIFYSLEYSIIDFYRWIDSYEEFFTNKNLLREKLIEKDLSIYYQRLFVREIWSTEYYIYQEFFAKVLISRMLNFHDKFFREL